MELQTAIELLVCYNDCRLWSGYLFDENKPKMPNATLIGEAIETVTSFYLTPRPYPIKDLTDEQHTYYLKYVYLQWYALVNDRNPNKTDTKAENDAIG